MVTDKIVAMIEKGAGTYRAPWHVPGGFAVHPVNAATHAEYRGINVLTLWAEGMQMGYATPVWASYRQWRELGAQVRKNERGTIIMFWKELASPDDEADAGETGKRRYVARASWVFNAAQVEGYEPEREMERKSEFERIREIETFIEAVQATVHHGHATACYRRDVDVIQMPEREWFEPSSRSSAEEGYYAVLLHELTHWTGAQHRLNRNFGKRFGDNAYAFEELVAEIGAAFMCASFGISTEPRPDHATYVASWLTVLKHDPKAIFTAARKAQEAFEHLVYLAAKNDYP